MKILIVYSSKSGTTRDCAERLASLLEPNEAVISDLEADAPDISDFEMVIVGGYVRMGKASKAFKRFIKENEALLMETMHGFFLCCGLVESTEYYFEKSVSRCLLDTSISNMSFGGELRISKQKGLDKIIAKIILSSIKNHNADQDCDEEQMVPAVLSENISRFADEIRRSL